MFWEVSCTCTKDFKEIASPPSEIVEKEAADIPWVFHLSPLHETFWMVYFPADGIRKACCQVRGGPPPNLPGRPPSRIDVDW